MAKRSRAHGQICFAPWPKGIAPCTRKYLGVNTAAFWRQLMTVFASTHTSVDANTHDWPHGENFWPREDSRFATGEFKVGHRADRSLPGVGKDFGTLRKGIAPLPEMFGVPFPRAEAIHPPKDGLLQSVSSSPRQTTG